jgi:hypothetical protein
MSVSWLVRFDGALLAESAAMTDNYRLAFEQGQTPDPQEFYLAPLPPIKLP